VGNNTVVVVFVNSPVSQLQIDIAQHYGAVVIEYILSSLTPVAVTRFQPSTLRWIVYDHYMGLNEVSLTNGFSKIMFADVRDTAFQADPFELLPTGSNFVFQEGSVMGAPLSQNQWMSGWIKDCFSEKILAAAADKPVITAGALLLSLSKGRTYLKLMTSLLLVKCGLSQRLPACERSGVDQAAHNVIVHLGLLSNLDIKSEAEFPLANIANSEIWNHPGMQLENLQTHSYDRTTNSIQIQPLAVIHQYDRVPSLMMELANRYVYWKSYKSAATLWKQQPQCTNYHALLSTDVYAGQCDIGTARVVSADQCCSMCNNYNADQRCFGFYYANGQCHFKFCDHTNAPVHTQAAMSKALVSLENWYENPENGDIDAEALQISAFL
jgi:hypothetical protein